MFWLEKQCYAVIFILFVLCVVPHCLVARS